MKVQELIEKLGTLPPEAAVNVTFQRPEMNRFVGLEAIDVEYFSMSTGPQVYICGAVGHQLGHLRWLLSDDYDQAERPTGLMRRILNTIIRTSERPQRRQNSG